MARGIGLFLVSALVAGCMDTEPAVPAEELRAALSGKTVQLRPDGGPEPGEPDAFNFTFRSDGTLLAEPIGEQMAEVRDGDFVIRFPLGFEGAWEVQDGALCIGQEARLECQPATLSGDMLIVRDQDTGDIIRGRIPQSG